MGTSFCPVVTPFPYGSLLSQHDPDDTIRHFLQDNLDGAPIPSFSFSSHPSTSNPAPLRPWAAASESGGVTPDDRPTAGPVPVPVPSNTHSTRGPTGAISGSDGAANGTTVSSAVRNSTVESIVDQNANRGTLAGEQPYSVTTWANRNPGLPTIPLRPSRQISEAQKASQAISREQRAEKASLLDSAVQEYLVRQASEIEGIALKHNVMVEYVKGLIGGETHYHSNRKAQRHNALLRVKALEVNAGRSHLIDLSSI